MMKLNKIQGTYVSYQYEFSRPDYSSLTFYLSLHTLKPSSEHRFSPIVANLYNRNYLYLWDHSSHLKRGGALTTKEMSSSWEILSSAFLRTSSMLPTASSDFKIVSDVTSKHFKGKETKEK